MSETPAGEVQTVPHDQAESTRRVNWYRWLLYGLPIVVVIWGLVGIGPWYFLSHDDASRFGDGFGFVNSLFSAVALLGVILAIAMQSQELELQRRELELTRREMEQSRIAQQESEVALSEQAKFQFLSAYLNALNTSIDYYSAMQASTKSPPRINRMRFKANMLIDEVTSLTGRVRPLIGNYLCETPMTEAEVRNRMDAIAKYLRAAPNGDPKDCDDATTDAIEALSSLLPSVNDSSIRSAIKANIAALERIHISLAEMKGVMSTNQQQQFTLAIENLINWM